MNTYAEPASGLTPSSPCAPITMVSPSIATDIPKLSYASPSEAVSFAAWLHTPAESMVNT